MDVSVCFSLYKIFINPDMTFLRKCYMCMLCDSIVIYQYIYMYFFVAVIFDSHIYCITVICNIFLYISTINCHVTVIYYCVDYSYLVSYT